MPKGYPRDGVKRHRPCATCKHPERARIEALHASGVSLDRLAEKFGIGRDAIWRHMKRHVSADAKIGFLVGAGKLETLVDLAAEEGGSVLDHLRVLRSGLFKAFEDVAERGDHDGLVRVSAAILKTLSQLGRLTGEIAELGKSVNVTNNIAVFQSPAFLDLQRGLLTLCERHPEARGDVIDLLKKIDAKHAVTPAATVIEHEATHV